MFGIKDMMQQAQELQQRLATVQEELAGQVVAGSAGGGMITVEANGAQEIVSVKIEPQLLEEPDPEMLQDLIAAATNDALSKSKEMAQAEIAKLTGGLRIPGITPG